MDKETKQLIEALASGCDWSPVGDGSENIEVNSYKTNETMKKAADTLRAIFDPENQPSQYGTKLLS